MTPRTSRRFRVFGSAVRTRPFAGCPPSFMRLTSLPYGETGQEHRVRASVDRLDHDGLHQGLDGRERREQGNAKRQVEDVVVHSDPLQFLVDVRNTGSEWMPLIPSTNSGTGII